jgi:organic radical activating enzyme
MKVKITSVFHSIQGEGGLMGYPMTFVRFSGCSVTGCPLHPKWGRLCDTDWVGGKEVDVDSIVLLGEWVCITGGEPCDQAAALAALGTRAQQEGHRVMLQTSGTIPVPFAPDHLVVSAKEPLVVKEGHELKLVYQGQTDAELDHIFRSTNFMDYYLMPLHLHGKTNFKETGEAAMRSGWRMTVQAHKFWGVL